MSVVAAETSRTLGDEVLIANGLDEAHLVDALVCSAVSAGAGVPLLLVTRTSVPASTERTLLELGLDERFVVGGQACVSGGTRSELDAMRIAGTDRYSTAAAFGRESLERGWTSSAVVGVATTIPDALSGAGLLGRMRGPLLLTSATNLPKPTAGFMDEVPPAAPAFVFGGSGVVGDTIARQLEGAPAVPHATSLLSGTDKCGARIPLHVQVGVNTERVRVYRDGELITERAVGSYSKADLGDVRTVAGRVNEIKVVAYSADGTASSRKYRRRPLGYSWDDYIVVDKSDYRLYFVRNEVLTDVYPVAHGRNGRTPVGVWRIDAKYHSNPRGVYGPRKMRLYRRLSNGTYSFSAYLIHGTNQPWVIGTMASAGCIRMYNSDVLELYPKVPLHTMCVTRE
jgi:hypothetical protein